MNPYGTLWQISPALFSKCGDNCVVRTPHTHQEEETSECEVNPYGQSIHGISPIGIGGTYDVRVIWILLGTCTRLPTDALICSDFVKWNVNKDVWTQLKNGTTSRVRIPDSVYRTVSVQTAHLPEMNLTPSISTIWMTTSIVLWLTTTYVYA